MPLIIAKETIAQAASKQPVTMGLNSPDSSIEFVMLSAFRNQKYDVGDELEHSFTIDCKQTDNLRLVSAELVISFLSSVISVPVSLVVTSTGHCSHGRGYWKELPM